MGKPEKKEKSVMMKEECEISRMEIDYFLNNDVKNVNFSLGAGGASALGRINGKEENILPER